MKKEILYLSLCPLSLSVSAGNDSPNIVIFIGDDCRYQDLGCYGSPDAITPNIDRLASEGIRFDNFFQATAMSSPTRQCLMTGLYPLRSGAYPNHAMSKPSTRSIVHYLTKLGYHVALQGKRHINPESVFPFDYIGPWKNVDPKLIEGFLKKRSEDKSPFCLFVCSNDPHYPWTRGDRSMFHPDSLTLPEFIVDTPETRDGYVGYLAEINQLDKDLGAVDALIQKYGFSENTLFVFTSEHGFTFPFAKWTCYGQGLHTGFIARWPGKIKPGSVSSALCEYVDVVPTLIDIAGGEIPSSLDGKSFRSVLEGKTDNHKSYVYGIQTSRGIVYGGEHYAVRTVFDGRYRYILNLSHEEPFQCIQMQEKDSIWYSWCDKATFDSFAKKQVMRYVYRPEEELYDTGNDPYEINNLAYNEDYTEIKKHLKSMLMKWMKSQGDKGLLTEMEALEHMVPNNLEKYLKTKNKVILPCKD